MSKANGQGPIIVVRGDLKQRDVRSFELEKLRIGHDYLVSTESFSFKEAMLKAAIGANWIEKPDCRKDESMDGKQRVVEYYFGDVLVDDLHPSVCYAAGDVICNVMDDFFDMDPNSATPPQTPERKKA